MSDSILLIYSGGADSTTLLYEMKSRGWRVDCLTFDYGQRHKKEIECAKSICALNNARHDIICIQGFVDLVTSSLLMDEDVPNGHYESETMKKTVVPNRNMVMISIAASVAISRGYDSLCYAAHAGDHAIYPDCREGFAEAAMFAINEGNWLDYPFTVLTPFIDWSKHQIIERGIALDVPFNMTWTCYKGESEPCGLCGSCVERKEAFELCGISE